MSSSKPRPSSGYAFRRDDGEWDLVMWASPPKGCRFVGFTSIDGSRCAMWTTPKGDTYAQLVR